MTQATSAPTGGGPKDAQLQPPARPLGRPKKQPASNDPRDIAIAELENELAEAKAKHLQCLLWLKRVLLKLIKNQGIYRYGCYDWTWCS